jgi:hypothetical protein
MLEILAIYWMCKKIGSMLREKGRNPLGFQIMAVVLWLGGELCAGVGVAIVQAIRHGAETEPGLELYAFALLGAIIGALISFGIVWLIPPAAGAVNTTGAPPPPPAR